MRVAIRGFNRKRDDFGNYRLEQALGFIGKLDRSNTVWPCQHLTERKGSRN